MDMAGFAVSLSLVLAHPSATFSHLVQRGMQESHFLSHLVRVKDLEARADNCTKVVASQGDQIQLLIWRFFVLYLDSRLAHE